MFVAGLIGAFFSPSLAFPPGVAHADVIYWTNGGGDFLWCNRTNWSTFPDPDHWLPRDGDDVYITLDGDYTVVIGCILGPMPNAHLTLGGPHGSPTLRCEASLEMPVLVGPNAVVEIRQGGVNSPLTNWGKVILTTPGSTLNSPMIENEPGALIDLQSDVLLHSARRFRPSPRRHLPGPDLRQPSRHLRRPRPARCGCGQLRR